ncbi:hypothetical protein ACOMHN_044595 [Nucella lapillus]
METPLTFIQACDEPVVLQHPCDVLLPSFSAGHMPAPQLECSLLDYDDATESKVIVLSPSPVIASHTPADNAEEVFIIQINTLQATTCVACTSKFKTFRVHMGTAVLHSMEVSDTASPVRYTFMADQFDRSLRKIVMVIRFPNVPSTRTTERQILPNQPPSSSSTTTGMTSRMSPASSSPPRCAESCQEALEVLLKDKA